MQEVSELQFKINLLLAMASVADAELTRKSAEIAQNNENIVRKDDLIIRMSQQAVLKDNTISRLEEESAKKYEQITILTIQNESKDRRLLELSTARDAILASTSWRVTAIIRWLGGLFGNANDK